jgi:NagD protein
MFTPRDLAARLRVNGIDVTEEHIWTSALVKARFLDDQRPGARRSRSARSLTTALYQVGYVQTELRPDYVVRGETRGYSFERIAKAIRLIDDGARFLATNPDPTAPSPPGPCRPPDRSRR